MIINLSAQPAHQSNKLSKGVTESIVETVEKVAPDADIRIGNLNHIIRKNAHFFIYLVLSLLVLNALKISGVTGYKCFGFTLAVCILFAISDEVHQLFAPGRGGQVKAIMGIGFYGLVLYTFRIAKKKIVI
jgi:VanZ family protein